MHWPCTGYSWRTDNCPDTPKCAPAGNKGPAQPRVGALFTEEEREALMDRVEMELFQAVDDQVSRLRGEWDRDTPPDEYFDLFESALKAFVTALSCRGGLQ